MLLFMREQKYFGQVRIGLTLSPLGLYWIKNRQDVGNESAGLESSMPYQQKEAQKLAFGIGKTSWVVAVVDFILEG